MNLGVVEVVLDDLVQGYMSLKLDGAT
jgi:hypothetical protein